jgi:hypothetical protein
MGGASRRIDGTALTVGPIGRRCDVAAARQQFAPNRPNAAGALSPALALRRIQFTAITQQALRAQPMSNATTMYLHPTAIAAAGMRVRGRLSALWRADLVRRAFPHPIDRGVTR